MKPFPRLCAAALVLAAGFSQARADSVAIVLDDSVSMCGYLAKDKTTAYETLLKSLQNAIESTNDAVSLGLLSKSGGLANSRVGAMTELDRIVSNQTLPGTGEDKGAPAEEVCAFHATASLLGKVFSPDYDKAGLALLVTDFIFDTGANQGGSASELDFVDKFVLWSQGRVAQPTQKKSKTPKKTIEQPVAAVLSGPQNSAGIIALRSAFDGKYFLRESGKASVPIKIDNRPVYLFWRARSPELAEHWLKPILAKLAQKNIAVTVFQLLPSAASLDPVSPSLSHRPQALATLADAVKPQVHYANLSYERALERAGKSHQGELENPIDASINPAACFRVKGFHVYFDANCGKGGERESLFWEHRKIDEIRVEFVLENDMPGLERGFVSTPTGFRANSYRVDFKVDPVGKKTVSIALPKVGSGFFEFRGQKNGTPWIIDLQESMQLKNDQFNPANILKDWSSDEEPCETGETCKAAQDKTVDLVHFVQSMINRTNQGQPQSTLPPPQTVRVEFHMVGQLP